MKHEDLIKRINELANKAKTTGLNEAEKAEQQQLRNQYIEIFRGNLKSQLDSIVIMDEQGNKKPLDKKTKTDNKFLS